MKQLNLTDHDQKVIKSHFIQKKMENLRQSRLKEKITHYKPLKIIGRGAFGEVRLC